jgi:hypothetical protein
MPESIEDQIGNSLADAMEKAQELEEGTVQRITVDATATGQYPFRIITADDDFIVCGLTPARKPVSDSHAFRSPAEPETPGKARR